MGNLFSSKMFGLGDEEGHVAIILYCSDQVFADLENFDQKIIKEI
jgi:hypothetical protein